MANDEMTREDVVKLITDFLKKNERLTETQISISTVGWSRLSQQWTVTLSQPSLRVFKVFKNRQIIEST